MELAFNIEGEFVTQTARDWFYKERRPFKKVQEFLLSCMSGTEIPLETLKKYAEDVLKFKRKFIGNTANNSFGLVDEIETNNLSKYYEELKKYGKLPFEICEYGFINPQGSYIPVEWCNHSQWASDYLKENLKNKDWLLILSKYKCDATDALVKGLNWILIDSPHQEKGIVYTGDIITKAQKETLFDYYMFFSRKQEAKELYKEN